MAVTPKGIVTPDASSPYNLITDLNTLASTTDAAITNASNMLKGTASQRTTALAGAPDGTLWQDTDGIKMIWRKDGAVWVPAVWRWSGTTAQMNAFTQAPQGFEWSNTSNGFNYQRSAGSWRRRLAQSQEVPISTIASSSGQTVSVTFPTPYASVPDSFSALASSARVTVGLLSTSLTGASLRLDNWTSGPSGSFTLRVFSGGESA